ncbi:hypothetical protein BB559_003626, partial [Furculomyces boomerangus]
MCISIKIYFYFLKITLNSYIGSKLIANGDTLPVIKSNSHPINTTTSEKSLDNTEDTNALVEEVEKEKKLTADSISHSTISNIKTLDRDSSEEQSEKEEEDWYAGGEKSGISIKAPGSAQADSIDLVGKILKKAAEPTSNRRELSDDESAPSNKNFKGK